MKFLAFTCMTVFVAMFCILPARSEDITEGLVGYWKFNEGEGEAASDSSGMDNHGVFVGDIEWGKGKFGTALEFSKSQSCLKVQGSESINFVKDFTIALWAKPAAETQPSYGKMICRQKVDEYPYAIQYDSSGEKIRGTVYSSGRFDMPGTPNFTEWGHVALTYDGEVEIL